MIYYSPLALLDESVDLDSLLSGDGVEDRGGKICRKCFYSYEKLLKVQELIESDVRKAIASITAQITHWKVENEGLPLAVEWIFHAPPPPKRCSEPPSTLVPELLVAKRSSADLRID